MYHLHLLVKMIIKTQCGDFPGGTVNKTPHSQCRGPGSIPGQGTRSHTHDTTKSSRAEAKEPACRN